MTVRPAAWIAALAALTATLALTVAAPSVADEPPVDPTPAPDSRSAAKVLIFGDSISARGRYGVQGEPGRPKAWWAYVAEAADLPFSALTISAESGSGLLARGKDASERICSGTRYRDRLPQLAATKPDVVIVAVGRNDVKRCVGSRKAITTEQQRRRSAYAYFGALAKAADRQGMRRSHVYVMSPWGSSRGAEQVAVTALYERLATARGFTWIPLPALVRSQTVDAIHPNARGARSIARWAMRGSNLIETIASTGRAHAGGAPGARVLCEAAACRETPWWSPSTGRPIWGLPPGTARHHVAQQLSGRATALPARVTASRWRQVAVASGAAAQFARPRVGDVAWWPTAPTGVRGAGHVAIVAKVAHDNSAVVVTEVVAGRLRATRYSGASLPRGYLRFHAAGDSSEHTAAESLVIPADPSPLRPLRG